MTERLKKVFNYLVSERRIYSQADFARQIGKSTGQLSSMLKGTASVTNKTAGAISDAFPEINRAWLITGEGEMLTTMQQHPITQTNSVTISNVGNSSTVTDNSAELAALKAENARLREEVEWLRSLIQK